MNSLFHRLSIEPSSSPWVLSAANHLWQVSGFTNDLLLLILGLGSVYKSAWNHHPCTIPPRSKGKLRNDLSIKVVYTSQFRTYGWCKGKMEHDLWKFNISAGILYLNISYWQVQIFYINHENPTCGDLKACWSMYSGHFTLHCLLDYICLFILLPEISLSLTYHFIGKERHKHKERTL